MPRHLLPIFIAIWVFAWHGRALTGYFYADDWFQITPRSAATVLKTFAGDWNMGSRTEGGFYRPMVRVTFALDRLLWGDRPGGYHFTGLLLLAANAVLVWALGRRLLREEALAFAAALGFVLLPTLAEVSWWVSARADLLAGLGVLGALVLWSNPLKEHLPFSRAAEKAVMRSVGASEPGASAGFGPLFRTRLAAWGALLFGLLSKEIAAAGLLLVPVLDFLLRLPPVGKNGQPAEPPNGDNGFGGPDPRLGAMAQTSLDGSITLRVRPGGPLWRPWFLHALLPAAAIGLAYLAWRTWALGGIGGYLAGASEPMSLARVGETYRQFLSAVVWPPGTAGAYGHHWPTALILFGAALLATRFRRDLVFFLAAILVAIAPMAGLGLSPLAGGRYMLLPGAFGLLAWAALVPPAVRQLPRPFRWVPAFFLLFYSFLWTPTLFQAERLWAAASRPNERAMAETWKIVESLPADAPGQIGVIPAPISGGYHVWAAGCAMPVALHAWALSRGWQAEWGPVDDPYPIPIILRRPDGATLHSWFGVPPDLRPGALILHIDAEGRVRRHQVQSVERRRWDAADLARWDLQGPARIGLHPPTESPAARPGTEEGPTSLEMHPLADSTTPTLQCVLDAPGVWLIEPDMPAAQGEETSPVTTATLSQSPRTATVPTEIRWVTIALTGTWNRAGGAWIDFERTGSIWRGNISSAGGEATGLASLPSGPFPVAIPVPPMAPYRTAFAQAGRIPWPSRCRLAPLDRPGRATIQSLELIAYSLQPLYEPSSGRPLE